MGYSGKESAGFVDAADFEKIKRQGDQAIKKWIDEQLEGTSVTVVLVGAKTCSSRWVKYEIQKSIERGNGLLGIDVSKIKDLQGILQNVVGGYRRATVFIHGTNRTDIRIWEVGLKKLLRMPVGSFICAR